MMQTVLQSRTSDEATAALMTLCNTGASSASEAGVLLQQARNALECAIHDYNSGAINAARAHDETTAAAEQARRWSYIYADEGQHSVTRAIAAIREALEKLEQLTS